LITLTLVTFAFDLRHINHFVGVTSRHATPAHAAVFSRLLFRIVALAALLLAVFRVRENHLALQAAPALARDAAVSARFFRCVVTLASFGLAIFPIGSEQFVVEAAPARAAMLIRFFL
jgi:hypothetical protein